MMRRKMAKAMSAFMICCAMMTAFAAPSVKAASILPYWHISGQNVNLRTAPGTGNLSLGWLDYGDRFSNGGKTNYKVDGYYWRKCAMTTGRNAGKTGYAVNNHTRYGYA